MRKTHDFVVVGAGVFGAWIARHLRLSGATVALLDAYGPANSRASSGGETRIIRMGYGADELYTQWAKRSFPVWEQLELQLNAELLHRTGVLWLSNDSDEYTKAMLEVFSCNEILCEKLNAADLRQRYPELQFDDVTWGLLEPQSGILMARRAVQLLVFDLEKAGVSYIHGKAASPMGIGKVTDLRLASGDPVSGGTFIFACGPWLPKVFPELLGDRIFPSRQEVFFLGSPPGNDSFRPPKMPVWLHHRHPDIPYALPDIEGRGFKLAFDRHGDAIDPDCEERIVESGSLTHLRQFLGKHIPGLKDAPVLETRVCQYENTWNGDFLIDRHPDYENVWLVGGGSGHGFKHGPAVGEYMSELLLRGGVPQPRFSLASKKNLQARAVY
ncbi:MAG TPA: FAD-dependent oxidoreductase [Candidatus Angelobacter sp.]|nr:FAD-dependent oxidoreductase [Candidatus Angelobacter sp.]